MNSLVIGNKILNLDRLVFTDDVVLDDEPTLAVFMDGDNEQPLLLVGEERELLLAWLQGDEDDDEEEYVCEDCQRQGEADCN
jgi:hypothetical protein